MCMQSLTSFLNHSFCLIVVQEDSAPEMGLLSGMKRLAEEPATTARLISNVDRSIKLAMDFYDMPSIDGSKDNSKL